ncbi:hypothetical protein BC834DRAFT_373710 [Gloeopeniophorella convolvens]|nr:hypothetical protein BC834DRAFT_373710 [Gloeopeniophorella convolvens]
MAGAVDPSDVSYEGLGVAPNMEVIRGCMDVTAAPPISQLRQETNRGITSPISVLPSDVLLLIFEACIRGAPLSDLSHPGLALVGSNHQAQSLNDPPIPLRVSTSPLLGWIVCSHVCRRWRSLALTTPSLWTVVFLDLGPTWLNQSLSRSRSAPGVRFFGHLTAAYDTFLKHSSGRVVDFSRASQISVVASRDNLFSFLDGFRFVAPALKNVELTGSSDVFGPRGDTQHAPLGLLMRNSPYLKHISLHSILVVWTPLQTHARHLTHLEISFHTYFFMSTSPIARIEDAVGFLQSAPALEVLILIEGFVECSMEHAKSRGPRAELPHLRKSGYASGIPGSTKMMLPP